MRRRVRIPIFPRIRIPRTPAAWRRVVVDAYSTITPASWELALDAFGHACAYCGRMGVPLEKDHIWPVSKGGISVPQNIVPACHECNQAKGSMSTGEWLGRLDRFQRMRFFAGIAAMASYRVLTRRLRRR